MIEEIDVKRFASSVDPDKSAAKTYQNLLTSIATMDTSKFSRIWLVRHGETAWSITGQHTGLTDLPLTEQGERNAERLAPRLQGLNFAKVLTSPLQRARRTCELAGFAARAEVEPDLVEWNYGQHEGRRTSEIRKEHPNWDLFHDGCPDGENLDTISARADRV